MGNTFIEFTNSVNHEGEATTCMESPLGYLVGKYNVLRICFRCLSLGFLERYQHSWLMQCSSRPKWTPKSDLASDLHWLHCWVRPSTSVPSTTNNQHFSEQFTILRCFLKICTPPAQMSQLTARTL